MHRRRLKKEKETKMRSRLPFHVSLVLAVAAVVLLGASGAGAAGYIQTNLVSDGNIPANFTDTNLVNPWGIAFSPTSPFWIADNGTGLSTLYNSTGTPQALVVTIPPPGGGTTAAPTGTVYNGVATDFLVVTGAPARFLFDTEDGTISGWNAGTSAVLEFTSGNAVYKGLALAARPTGNFLYATNFRAGTIDVLNSSWVPAVLPGAFTEPNLPVGFAPFNIRNFGGTLFVTYAKQDAALHDDVAGPGLGVVAEFDANGTFLKELIPFGGHLNSPWGLAMAPAGFGELAGDLLVGDFGDGLINAYNPTTGAFLGTLSDPNGVPIHIDGLWGLMFGNGGSGGDPNMLYFTAGPNGEADGLFGRLAVPEPASMTVLALAAAFFLRRRRSA
jgi:uncharacterized protein (TIGR03118 family)